MGLKPMFQLHCREAYVMCRCLLCKQMQLQAAATRVLLRSCRSALSFAAGPGASVVRRPPRACSLPSPA